MHARSDCESEVRTNHITVGCHNWHILQDYGSIPCLMKNTLTKQINNCLSVCYISGMKEVEVKSYLAHLVKKKTRNAHIHNIGELLVKAHWNWEGNIFHIVYLLPIYSFPLSLSYLYLLPSFMPYSFTILFNSKQQWNISEMPCIIISTLLSSILEAILETNGSNTYRKFIPLASFLRIFQAYVNATDKHASNEANIKLSFIMNICAMGS